MLLKKFVRERKKILQIDTYSLHLLQNLFIFLYLASLQQSNYNIYMTQPIDSKTFAAIVQQLYAKSQWKAEQYKQLLQQHNILVYLTQEKFCSMIRSKVGESETAEFAKRFLEDCEKYQEDGIEFHFPFILHSNSESQFQQIKLRTFADVYASESQARQKSEQDQLQRDPNTMANHSQKYELEQTKYYHFDFSQKRSKRLIFKKLAQKKKPIKRKNKRKKALVDPPIYKIPSFFNEYIRSNCQLLQLNVTQYFSHQLKDVKTIIQNQLVDENGWIIRQYVEFLEDYLVINSIRQGQCDKVDSQQYEEVNQAIQQYFRQYLNPSNEKVRYVFSKKQSIVLGYWRIIQENLTPIMEIKTQDINVKVKNILLKGMNNIYLTFQLASTSYANLNEGKFIFVNINQRRILPFQIFRQDTIKSYICLCLFHEFSHLLVRQYPQCKISENQASFFSQNRSIGNKIISLMKNYVESSSPEYIIDNGKFTPHLIHNQKVIQDFIENLYQRTSEYSTAFDSLARHKGQWEQIKTEFLLIGEVYFQILRNLNINQIANDWNQAYHYIDELQSYAKKHQHEIINEEMREQQQNYQFFCSLFCTEHISTNWIKKLKQDERLYLKYKDKLEKMQIQRFYVTKNSLIEEIIVKITTKSQFYKLRRKIKGYNKLFKKYKRPFESIVKRFECLRKKIQFEDICKFHSQSYQVCCKINTMWPNFSTKQYQYMLPKDIKAFCNIITVLNAISVYGSCMQFIKNSEAILIKYQLPSIYNVIGNKAKNFQSGYLIQKKLFPNFDGIKIYSKDYDLFKKIHLSYGKIGTLPLEKAQQAQYVLVERAGCHKAISSIEVGGQRCGVNFGFRLSEERRINIEKEREKELRSVKNRE